MNKKEIVVLILSVLGGGYTVFALSPSLAAIFWNMLPYIVFFMVVFLEKKTNLVLFPVVFIFFADAFFYFVMQVESESEYILALSVAVALKLFVVAPLGFVIGFFVDEFSSQVG